MAVPVRPVFVSHTSDMARFPAARSFVAAAVDAVLRTPGFSPVDMAYFAARDEQPAAFCVAQVEACDVYVGVIGLRYGSLVPGGGLSYTETEFAAATRLGIPRLIFMLDEDVPLPRGFTDPAGGAVDTFRQRLETAGLIVKRFRTPDGLEAAISQALGQLPKPPAAGVPWMAPPPTAAVDRPDVLEPLLAAVLASGGAVTGEAVTGVQGAGGFGKTTLARMICAAPAVRDRFPGGVLWVTLGEQAAGAELAGLVNGLCEVLTGEPGTSADPIMAGTRLGALLSDRPATLLVVDDVWDRRQLDPFLLGGQGCRRLITTRNRGVLPDGATSILVEEMTPAEAGGR